MKKDLTQGDLKQHIFAMAIPASIGMLFQALYNITDAYYVGQISTQALAALSLTFPVYFMIIALGSGIGGAVTAFVAQFLGAKNPDAAKSIAHQSVGLSLVLSIVLGVLGLLSSPFLFSLLGAKGEVLGFSLEYMNIIFFGLPFFFLSMLANSMLSAIGDTKRFGISLVIGFFLNLVLDPAFMYGWWGLPAMGIAGVAFATVLAQGFNLVYMSWPIIKTKLIDFSQPQLFFELSYLGNIVSQGVPSSLNYASTALGFLVITGFVSTYGDAALATYGIGTRIDQLIVLPCLGFAIATVAIVGQNYGAKNWERIKQHYATALMYGISSMSFGVVIVWVFAPQIVSLFSNDPLVLLKSVEYLRITSFGYIAVAVLMVSRSMLQGLTKASHSLAISLLQIFVISIPAILTFGYFFKENEISIWFGILTTLFATAAIAYWYVLHILNKNR